MNAGVVIRERRPDSRDSLARLLASTAGASAGHTPRAPGNRARTAVWGAEGRDPGNPGKVLNGSHPRFMPAVSRGFTTADSPPHYDSLPKVSTRVYNLDTSVTTSRGKLGKGRRRRRFIDKTRKEEAQ